MWKVNVLLFVYLAFNFAKQHAHYDFNAGLWLHFRYMSSFCRPCRMYLFFFFFPACSQFWLTAQSAVGVLQLMVLLLVSSVQDGKFLTMVVALLWKCEFFAAFLMKILRELWNTHSSTGGQWFYRYRQISMWNKKCSMQTLGLGCVSCKHYSVTHDAAHLNICCLS